MPKKLTSEQNAVATLLLTTGKTIKEISTFVGLDADAVRAVAREVDPEPQHRAQKRAKTLFESGDGLAYKDVASALNAEGFKTDDGKPIHHLTVAGWVRDFGWAWGGADDGEYSPALTQRAAAKTRYALRLSKAADEEINTPEAVNRAAKIAWKELSSDGTRVVQVAVIRGAAQVGVTDISAVRKQLLSDHGDEIRSARA